MQNINSILKEKGRTSVFVAHRLRTICDCDQILVLKEGQVAELGSHRELLDTDGIYAELWNGKLGPNRASFSAGQRMLTCSPQPKKRHWRKIQNTNGMQSLRGRRLGKSKTWRPRNRE